MRRISEDDFYDIIDCLIDTDQCPNGKQVTGCPVGDDTEPVFCEDCWVAWFTYHGLEVC